MTPLVRVVVATIALTACSPQQPTHADPTGAPMQDKDAVVARFTRDIWPAVEGYRAPGQGSPESRRFWSILDQTQPVDASNHALNASYSLGKVVGDDGVVQRSPDGPLHLANAAASALSDSTATVVACYTYVASDRDGKHPTNTSSEATFELHKTDAWYLRAITNDHVVPSCAAASNS